MNNFEWLIKMTYEQREAWLKAEHVEPNGGIRLESVVRPDSVDANDSREKLEADVDFIVKEGFVTYKSIIGWLDRQAAITYSIDAWYIEKLEDERDELQDQVDSLTAERDTWRNRFDKANREKCDLQSRGEQQRLNNLLNRLREKGVVVSWDDSRSDYMVLLNNCDVARELRAQVEQWMNAAGNSHDMWEKADSKRVEAERERDDLKAQIDEILEGANAGDSINVKLLSRIADMKATIHKHRVAAVKTSDLLRDIRDELAAVKAERDNLADDLLSATREREQLRRTLGIALDHAHDVLALMDGGLA